MKKNVAIVFGGESCEHDISIITAMQVKEAIDKEKYNIFPVYISKKGEWFTFSESDYFKCVDDSVRFKKVYFLPDSKCLFIEMFKVFSRQVEIDAVVLAMHGMNGEDGSISGLFQLNKIPCTSPGVLSSALACDKIVFKKILLGLNIPCVASTSLSFDDYCLSSDEKLTRLIKGISFPVIVKPANLGSSIGVYVCNDLSSFVTKLKLAFAFDERVLIEKYIPNCREINVAIYRAGKDLVISELEEPIKKQEILDFSKKYLDSGKSIGLNSMDRIIPAKFSRQVKCKIVSIAKKCYSELVMNGVVRFDFLLDENENMFLCEANTIPGAFANYLFKPKRISFSKLIDDLIDNSIKVAKSKDGLVTTFESSVLKDINLNGVKK